MASAKSLIAAGILAMPCVDAFVVPGSTQGVSGLRGTAPVSAQSESKVGAYSAFAAVSAAAVLSAGAKKHVARKHVACNFSKESQIGAMDPVVFFDPAGHDSALKLTKIFEQLLETEEKQNRYNRIKAWKQKLRSNTSHSYKWLKNKSKHIPVNITVTEQGTTANTHARLDSISKVWMRIYQQHKNGEPSMHTFLENYGANMRRANINLQNINASDVSKAISTMRPSAAGMDHLLLPYELKVACLWCPSINSSIADPF